MRRSLTRSSNIFKIALLQSKLYSDLYIRPEICKAFPSALLGKHKGYDIYKRGGGIIDIMFLFLLATLVPSYRKVKRCFFNDLYVLWTEPQNV